MSRPEQSPNPESTEDDSFVTDMVTEKATLSRRSLLKGSAILLGGSASTVAGISMLGRPVAAATEESDTSTTNGNAVSNTLGGEQTDVKLASDTNFKLTWNGLIRGDVIKLNLTCKPKHVSTPGVDESNPNPPFDCIGNRAVVGRMGYQVQKGTRSSTNPAVISGAEFFENRADPQMSLTKHPGVTYDFFNVDMDKDLNVTDSDNFKTIKNSEEWDDIQKLTGSSGKKDVLDSSNDDYVRVTVYELGVHVQMPTQQKFEKLKTWDLIVVLNAVTGWGMVWGESFGVQSDAIE